MNPIDAKLHKMTFTHLFRRRCHLLPLYSHFAWISLYNTSSFFMAAMPIYGKNPLNIFVPGTSGIISMKLGM